jgi:hypothetical protein
MDKIVCNICNKVYAPKNMTKHKQTLLHLENTYEYYVDERIEEKFENYFIKTYLYTYYEIIIYIIIIYIIIIYITIYGFNML